jgi:hypothetical protein
MTFKEWCDQYTSRENFDNFDDSMVSRMLLYSLWEHRQEEIDKLRDEHTKLKEAVSKAKFIFCRYKMACDHDIEDMCANCYTREMVKKL